MTSRRILFWVQVAAVLSALLGVFVSQNRPVLPLFFWALALLSSASLVGLKTKHRFAPQTLACLAVITLIICIAYGVQLNSISQTVVASYNYGITGDYLGHDDAAASERFRVQIGFGAVLGLAAAVSLIQLRIARSGKAVSR